MDVRLLLSLGQRFLFWMLIFYFKVICQLVRIFFVKTVLRERSVKTACRNLGELVCCAGILDHETYGGLGRANLSEKAVHLQEFERAPSQGWIKPASTFSRDLIMRRIDTTRLYHVTVLLWYHVKHQLLLNKMQSFL